MEKQTGTCFKIGFILNCVTSIGSAITLMGIKGNDHGGFLGGFSAGRISIFVVLLGISLLSLLGAFGFWDNLLLRVSKMRSAMIGSGFLAFLAYSAWVLFTFLLPRRFAPYAERLTPFFFESFVLGMTGLCLFARLCDPARRWKPVDLLRPFLIYLSLGIGIYLTIRLTGIGIVPDEMDWQPTGMTIQYWEIFLSVGLAFPLSWLTQKLRRKIGNIPALALCFVMVWATAAWLWISIPTMEVLNHSYFMEITAPNYLPYPASDAANFGVWVESIMAGLGFKSAIAYRQFLITVLAFFQTLTRGDILKTIDLNTALLALIPACLYLLGRQLHSDSAGFLAAGLATLREYNTILLAPHYMVSSSKMWLSDLSAMLCLLAAICASAAWFMKPRSLWRIVLAGCFMGLCVTVRSQFIVLTVFPLVFFFLRNGINWKDKLKYCFIFAVCVLVVIGPWFIRSKIITGSFILDDPGVHSTELARRYSDDVTNKVIRMEGESDADYAARNQQHMVDFFLEKPFYVVKFIMSHFFANEIYALCALPFGTDPALTLRDVTNTDFHDVEGRLTRTENIPVLMFFLVLIALGMAAAWRRCGWAGLLPFFMCSLYLGSTAAARYSGWRFALPGDWHFYFYFALGLSELIYLIAEIFGTNSGAFLTAPQTEYDTFPRRLPVVSAILIFFLFLGSAPPLLQLLPDRVRQNTSEENLIKLREISAENPEWGKFLEPLLDDPESEAVNGRDLYPRFFGANEGLASGHPWPAYVSRPFSRLGFVLLNLQNENIIIPMTDQPAPIPHAADVIVLGKRADDEIFLGRALIILPKSENEPSRLILGEKLIEGE